MKVRANKKPITKHNKKARLSLLVQARHDF